MERVWALADRIADTDVPVLVVGESGVGKDVVARRIHATSRRSDRPFVKINCAALPAELLESELFGHEKGAFTGAHAEKPGKFELADQGTIFLARSAR
jgi:two-component system response regulator AtoC